MNKVSCPPPRHNEYTTRRAAGHEERMGNTPLNRTQGRPPPHGAGKPEETLASKEPRVQMTPRQKTNKTHKQQHKKTAMANTREEKGAGID